MKKQIAKIVCALAAVLALPGAMAGEPARFVELHEPDAVRTLGEEARVLVFRDGSAAGVRLHNASDVEIHVQDVVSLSNLVLAPGMQLSLSCESARHLAVSVDNNVVYESVTCGSMLRFADAGGAQ